MISKSIELPKSINISINTLNNKKVLIFLSNIKKNYILIPNDINFEKKGRCLTFFSNNKKVSDFNLFVTTVHNILGVITVLKLTRKKLILRGLGFKMSFLNNDRIIEFKLGFSHIITLGIPDDLKVTLERLKITVEGLNSTNVGNFISKLKSLKAPDLYKGKGFWYQNEAMILKEVKKK